MEFVPLTSFEFLNSLLQGVEAQGCLMTIRLEAFTCRSTRKKRQLAASMAQYANANTPPLVPAPNDFSVPPPLSIGGASDDTGALPVAYEPIDPDNIDDRLVYLVAALNSIYGEDGYDFSVLTEEDFSLCDEAHVRAEVNVTLQSMPDACRLAADQFWPRIAEQVGDASQGCEYFCFQCPSCDPIAARTLFSHHYFLYNKRARLLVSLLMYAEGNAYRGDDGCIAGNGFYIDGDDTGTERDSWCGTPDPTQSDDEAYRKNRHFYYST